MYNGILKYTFYRIQLDKLREKKFFEGTSTNFSIGELEYYRYITYANSSMALSL